MTRVFAFTQNCTIVSVGLFDLTSKTVAEDITSAAQAKGLTLRGLFLTGDEVYRLIETGTAALREG